MHVNLCRGPGEGATLSLPPIFTLYPPSLPYHSRICDVCGRVSLHTVLCVLFCFNVLTFHSIH